MGVEQQANLPLARRLLDLFIARNQRARPRFQPEPVERRALQLRLDPRAKIGGDRQNGNVPCPREPALELALPLRGFQIGPRPADPPPPPPPLSLDVGRGGPVPPRPHAPENKEGIPE